MGCAWLIALGAAALLLPAAHAETLSRDVGDGVVLEITYPGAVVAGRDAAISVLATNGGWEDKLDVVLEFRPPAAPGLEAGPPGTLGVGRLSEGGSFGESVRLRVPAAMEPGLHYLNLRYSHVPDAGGRGASLHDIAIPITVRAEPRVSVQVRAPESVFANAEFPLTVAITPEDAAISDVRVRIIPPDGVGFAGQTLHAFSAIGAGAQVEMESSIAVPDGEVASERRLPFGVVAEYVDDAGEQRTDSQTVPVLLRPRTFMEITSEGGVWIGGFFIAPYVSIGTIIGIPAGTLLSLLARRRGSRGRRKKPRA